MFEDVTDNIFHIFFLTFRRPNNQSIGQENNQQMNQNDNSRSPSYRKY